MNKTVFILMIFGFGFISCLDDLEVELPENPDARVVVSGYIERADSFYHLKVYVARTFTLQPISKSPQVEAEIELLLNNSPVMGIRNNIEEIFPVEDFHRDFGGHPEKATFAVKVNTLGNTYLSEPVRIISNPPAPEFTFKIDTFKSLTDNNSIVDNKVIQLKTNQSVLNANGERVSQLWQVKGKYLFAEIDCTPWLGPADAETNNCYIDHFRGTAFSLFAAREDLGSEIKDFTLDEIPVDYHFHREYYYTIIRKSLTGNAALYWSQVQQSLSREGSIYDIIPGKVISNVSNESGVPVIGYFYGTEVDTFRYKVLDRQVGAPDSFCKGLEIPDHPECCDCILNQNSSFKKPRYWR